MFDYAQIEGGNRVQIDRSRDENLTKFGIETLYDRYLLPEEGPQDLHKIHWVILLSFGMKMFGWRH